MGLWRALMRGLATASLALGSPAVGSPAQGANLATARALLAGGELAKAREAYRQIGMDHADWAGRLEDALRLQLGEGRPEEAWRLAELARRLEVPLPDLAYYQALAAAKAQVCVLNQPAAEPRHHWLLLVAYTYRFGARFVSERAEAEGFADAEPGKAVASLGAAQTHYLKDLPKVRLERGRGCSSLASRLEDREVAQATERAALSSWHGLMRAEPSRRLAGSDAVELRLIELSLAAEDEALVGELLARYAGYSAAEWRTVPEPERRFLWQGLVKAGRFKAPPYRPGEPLYEVVLAIIRGTKTPEAATSAGLLDLRTAPSRERETLVRYLLTLPDLPHRPYLLLTEAELAHVHGRVAEALAIIRRLLVGDEAQGDPLVERRAGELASRILAEYGYDEAMLGAIEGSLPASWWGGMFRRLLMDHALTGHRRGFAALRRLVGERPPGRAVGLDGAEMAVLEALATRQRGALLSRLGALAGEERLEGRRQRFFADLGARTLSLSLEERRSVEGELALVHELLSRIWRRQTSDQRLGELVRLFGDGAGDRYEQGRESVRGKPSRPGSSPWRERGRSPGPFSGRLRPGCRCVLCWSSRTRRGRAAG